MGFFTSTRIKLRKLQIGMELWSNLFFLNFVDALKLTIHKAKRKKYIFQTQKKGGKEKENGRKVGDMEVIL
ncbi:hypothetical protein MTR_2g056140 [Medicago truncatula]|uniref:Uncharacterized protein n=1 Tax=Medicago truncatula TaxID=3880 RepID=A0A072V7K5_MEDTR|nr:hypothetical protein MTR_2g056140 [Medicago truncatula]